MEKFSLLCILFCSIVFYGQALPKKKVCVIGAGRAGLAAIKLLADQSDVFEPVAFERNSDVGGLWIYTDKTGLDEHGLPVHSSIYKNLRTITRKGSMTYPDYPTFNSPGNNEFVSHENFLEYLRNYTNHFGLRKYIQFNTLVIKVTPIKSKCKESIKTRWHLKKRNLNSNVEDTITCDAVMVCNGRFSKPNIPKIPGIETFPGRVLHSRDYRRPENFANQTVALLGTGASGSGIARDLAGHAKDICLIRRNDCDFFEDYPPNVMQLSRLEAVNGRQLIFHHNYKITADAFIYCTGYVYDFPFLDESCGIVVDENYLFPLYKEFINRKYTSMAFIGMGKNDVFAIHYYSKAKTFLEFLQG